MNRRSKHPGNKYDLKKAFSTWLRQHAQACVFSAGQLFKNPLNTFLTTAVVGIALALPAGFYLLLENCQRVAVSWDNSAQISLFLKMDVGAERSRALAEKIRHFPGIAGVNYISPDAALTEYQQQTAITDALPVLEDNPLPAVLLLQPELNGLSGPQSDALLQRLRALPEVDTAQFDRQWIQRLFAIINLAQRAIIILSTLLAIAVVLIIGNTIRLAIFNRRSEIEINKLFGATEAFIQRPFLYAGLFHGIAGSLLAWGMLSLFLGLLDGPVARLAGLYSSDFTLHGLSSRGLIILFAAGAGLGLLGSWVSVQQHIKAIEPN